MKPSDIAVERVKNKIRLGIAKDYDTCCSECRVALLWMIDKKMVNVVDGQFRLA